MDKDKTKKAQPDIDEELMMNLMVEGVKIDRLPIPLEPIQDHMDDADLPNQKPSGKEKDKTKKIPVPDYETLFFKKPDTNARDGKTVYIRPDFHEKLSRIVQVIGEDKLTIYAYLDNLLEYHFHEFGDQITISFNNKYKPIL
ncbi:DUF3408 domain-containing protein [Chryseobacterium sp. ISL-6]|uniref:DUF3408 domain-containing protein n=1 Tax=Chryseobacterium sp. ISL-6 TaxID=2819143 RepID=UPI001BECA853|nr:DUF3408 domain-containing protein [Chryseobacterium sp. ISL-6]MBT2623595.1 DUF3408 domain-containing protein [Chryseobacterium sp. ISL-6]